MYQKWPDQIFPIVNFVFSHYGHFGLGRGGGVLGEGSPPIILKKPCPIPSLQALLLHGHPTGSNIGGGGKGGKGSQRRRTFTGASFLFCGWVSRMLGRATVCRRLWKWSMDDGSSVNCRSGAQASRAGPGGTGEIGASGVSEFLSSSRTPVAMGTGRNQQTAWISTRFRAAFIAHNCGVYHKRQHPEHAATTLK